MMRLSFIVTIREHADTLGACLQSVLASAVAGDEVILIDERSCDESRMLIAAASAQLRRGHPVHGHVAIPGPEERKGATRSDALTWRPMRLGARPHGGRAVGANTGLSMATGDGVIVLTGRDRLDPAGVGAARLVLAQSGADMVLGRFTGAYADDENRLWNRRQGEQDTFLTMEAQPARMLLRRDFLTAEGLRFDEGPFMLEEHPFHWSVCLHAKKARLLDRVVAHGPALADEAGASAETLSVVFAHHRRMLAMLAPDGPHAALRDWLARMVGRHLAALAPMDYWAYAATAEPPAAGVGWPEGRGGRALEALANRPLWQAVALWQSEAIWADLAQRGADGGADQDLRDCPQRQAARRAIALWRGMRSGGPAGGFKGSDSSSA